MPLVIRPSDGSVIWIGEDIKITCKKQPNRAGLSILIDAPNLKVRHLKPNKIKTGEEK